jgi:hypothetical protein
MLKMHLLMDMTGKDDWYCSKPRGIYTQIKMMTIRTCEERTRPLVHNLPKVIYLCSMTTKIFILSLNMYLYPYIYILYKGNQRELCNEKDKQANKTVNPKMALLN